MALSLTAGISLAAYAHRNSDLTAALPPAPARSAIVFVIDGLGPGDLSALHLPTIDGLENGGTVYTRAWVGQTEATAVSSNASLATGLFPSHTGVVGWQWAAPGAARPEDATSNVSVRLGALDAVMQERAGSSAASAIKNVSPTARIASVAGAGCAAADAAGTWAADYILCARASGDHWVPGSITGHAPPAGILDPQGLTVNRLRGGSFAARTEGWPLGAEDDWVTRLASRVLVNEHPRMLFINFPEMETALRFAPPARKFALTRRLLSGIDRDIGVVLARTRQIGTLDRTVAVVTSDQALAPIRHHVSRLALEQAVLQGGGEQVYLDADMSAALGLRDRLQIPSVASAVGSADLRNIDVVLRRVSVTRPTYRIVRVRAGLSKAYAQAETYLAETAASATAPGILAVYRPGTTTGRPRTGTFPETSGLQGMEWESLHIPLIFWGHGVVQGATSTTPASLVDIAPTLLRLLGVTGLHSDGVVLTDALYQSSPAERAANAQLGTRLGRVVSALQLRQREGGKT